MSGCLFLWCFTTCGPFWLSSFNDVLIESPMTILFISRNCSVGIFHFRHLCYKQHRFKYSDLNKFYSNIFIFLKTKFLGQLIGNVLWKNWRKYQDVLQTGGSILFFPEVGENSDIYLWFSNWWSPDIWFYSVKNDSSAEIVFCSLSEWYGISRELHFSLTSLCSR